MIETTLVIIKPDGVERLLTGKILARFEDAGLKLVGLKMLKIDRKMAMRHYTEDLARRRGAHIRNVMVDYISAGPVVAAAIEGVNAIEVVRKLTGDTEPRAALPGTIRGDFTHVSYKHADGKKGPVKNVIHASSSKDDAKHEIDLWFDKKGLNRYKSVHDIHVL
jgi:nucleoside-diphosphate kinase